MRIQTQIMWLQNLLFPTLLSSPPFPMTGHSASFPFATKNFRPLLCAKSGLLSAPAPLGDGTYELSPGHPWPPRGRDVRKDCTRRLRLAEATVQPRTSPVSSCSSGFATDFLTPRPQPSSGPEYKTCCDQRHTHGGRVQCLKAEPRGQICAQREQPPRSK